MLKVGDKIPLDIRLEGENSEMVSLGKLILSSKYTVIYFYPKDNTPGCTTEACSLRDSNDMILELGAQIIGISKDNQESHQKFKEKHSLNFTLLSDPDAKLMKKFGVWKEKNMFGKKYFGTVRSTFIVNADGEILLAWPKVKPTDHGQEVYKAIKNL